MKATLAQTKNKVITHSFVFELKTESDKEGLEAIAKRFHDKFHDVQVTPDMMAREKMNNRPRNTKCNGVWGLKLAVN